LPRRGRSKFEVSSLKKPCNYNANFEREGKFTPKILIDKIEVGG